MTVAELRQILGEYSSNEQVGVFNPASGDWSPIGFVDRTAETVHTHFNGKVITIWPADDIED